jgi:hypothetical protein
MAFTNQIIPLTGSRAKLRAASLSPQANKITIMVDRFSMEADGISGDTALGDSANSQRTHSWTYRTQVTTKSLVDHFSNDLCSEQGLWP